MAALASCGGGGGSSDDGGAAYVDRVLVDTSSMTKTFGLVLGLIGFLWIGAVMAVLAMEINVVLTPEGPEITGGEPQRELLRLLA